MDGILIVDKPAGPTSHDVVATVKRLIGASKVGHLGTLDPAASGVLPLAINGATKRAGELAGIEKTYEFTLELGRTTTTDDDTGEVVAKSKVPADALDRLNAVIPQFIGNVMQRPPKFSAVKVSGRRAYQLARKGTDFQLDERTVKIDAIAVLGGKSPSVRMRVECNSGTYVRSLCRDLGEEIGCGAHASEIRRLRSGPYIIDGAVKLEELGLSPQSWRDCIIPL